MRPLFDITVMRQPGCPSKPTKATLAKLFARAWRLAVIDRGAAVAGAAQRRKRFAVDVLLVTDREIARLNRRHLKHSGPTDVLSFPMGEFDPERQAYNLGEIVASFDTARREARARTLPFNQELCRYCVHGFLHLLGYEDDTDILRDALFGVQEKALE